MGVAHGSNEIFRFVHYQIYLFFPFYPFTVEFYHIVLEYFCPEFGDNNSVYGDKPCRNIIIGFPAGAYARIGNKLVEPYALFACSFRLAGFRGISLCAGTARPFRPFVPAGEPSCWSLRPFVPVGEPSCWSLRPFVPVGEPSCWSFRSFVPAGEPSCRSFRSFVPVGEPSCRSFRSFVPAGEPSCGSLRSFVPAGEPSCRSLRSFVPAGEFSEWSFRFGGCSAIRTFC